MQIANQADSVPRMRISTNHELKQIEAKSCHQNKNGKQIIRGFGLSSFSFSTFALPSDVGD